MKTVKRSPVPWSLLGVLAALAALTTPAAGQVMLSGNETKVDLTGGGPKVIPGATADADSVTLLDFSQFPPSATHVKGVANTVVGPPSNIAISPDGKVALVANSIRLDPSAAAGVGSREPRPRAGPDGAAAEGDRPGADGPAALGHLVRARRPHGSGREPGRRD